MHQILQTLNQYFSTVPAWSKKHRKKLFFFYFLLLVFLGFGLPQIKLDMSLESFFEPNDPAIETMNRFKKSFQSDEGIYLVYRAKDGDVLSNQSLKALLHLQNRIDSLSLEEGNVLERITRITSLINVNYLEVKGDDLISRDFIGSDLPLSDEVLAKRRVEGLSHPDLPEVYFSKDFKLAALMLESDLGTELDLPDLPTLDELDLGTGSQDTPEDVAFKPVDMYEYSALWHPIEALLQEKEVAEHLEFYPVGNAILMSFFVDVVLPEMNPIFGGTIFLVVVMLLLLFRSFSAVIWPMVIVLFAILLTMGMIGWVGLQLNMMIQIVALLLLVVGIADGVHILSGYLYHRRRGLEHDEAMAHTYAKSGLACLLTSLTTSVGLGALIMVPIKPIQNFGISASIGVVMAFLLTLYLLPLLMDLWHPATKLAKQNKLEGHHHLAHRITQALASRHQDHPWKMIFGFVVVFLIFLYGFLQVEIDSNMLEIIEDDKPIKIAYELVDQSLGGSSSLEVLIETGQGDGLQDPKILGAMEQFQDWVESAYPVRVKSTRSLVDIVKYSSQVLNENRPEMYIIPQTRNQLAQTLFLFDSSSLEDRLQMASEDYATGRISIRMLNGGSKEIVVVVQAINQKLDEIFSPLRVEFPNLQVSSTGSAALMMAMVEHISWSQVKSFAIAIVVISAILLVVFGSLKVGLLAMLPNIFPIVVTFGVMGFAGILLDLDTLIVAPIVIGIAVDDTIHFLTHYKEEYLRHGDISIALTKATEEAGQAIIFTSLILATGFLYMMRFSHLGLAHFGFLAAIAILMALIADLFLLPAILTAFKVRFNGARS